MSEQVTDSATGGLVKAATTGGGVTLACAVVFEIIRRFVPEVFELRRVLKERGEGKGFRGESLGVADPPGKVPLFGWILSTIRQTPRALEKTHGLDAAFFSRYYRTRVLLHIALCALCCGCLIPVYWTAGNKDLPEDNPSHTVGFQRYSLGNVSVGDPWRFWVTYAVYVLSSIITIAFTLYDYRAFDEARRRFRSSNDPSNYAVIFQDIPEEFATEEKIYSYWNGIFPSEVVYVHRAFDAKKLVKKQARWLTAVTKRERAEWEFVNSSKLAGQRPRHKVGGCACCKGSDTEVDTIDYWKEQEAHYTQKINTIQETKDGLRPLHSAIVVFRSKRSASVAAQVMFASTDSEWRACRAPDPRAINYNALSMSGKTRDLRAFFAFSLIFALTIFWVIPVTFIQGLANLQQLAQIEISGKKPFKFLEGVLDWNDAALDIITGLLPGIIQSVFLSLIPVFIRLFVSISRVVSLARMDTLVRNWYHFFLFMNGFIFVLLGGAIIQALPQLIVVLTDLNWREGANILAKAVPSQGTFFMTFVILKALLDTPLQLLQLPRVILRWLFRKILCRTPRELNSKDMGGALFIYFRYYAYGQLIFTISLTYAVISPLVVPCCLCYFITGYLVHTHNISFTHVQPFDASGDMFPDSIGATFVALGFQGFILGAVFGLNGAEMQSTLSFVTCAVSMMAYLYMRRRFPRVTKHGSLVEAQIADIQTADKGKLGEEIARLYIHPGLAPLPNPVPNMSGVDEEKLAEVHSIKRIGKQMDLSENDVERGMEIKGFEGIDVDSPVVDSESHKLSEQPSVYEDARSSSKQE